jgi:acetate kinase
LPVLARGQIDGLHNKPRLRIQTLHDDVTPNHPVAGWKQAEEASIGISQAVAIGEGHDAVIEFLLGYLFEQLLVDHSLIAVGHRIVHGGQHYSAPTLIDA